MFPVLAQIPLNPRTIDLSQFITTAVDQLVNQYSGLFLNLVQPYLKWALIVGLVISGMFWMFDYPHRAMRYLWHTIVAFAVVTFLLRYYAIPMPLVGIPFSQIFRMEGRFLSAYIDIGLLNTLLQNLSAVWAIDKPNAWNLFETIGYFLVLGAMTLPELALFVETSFAIIALGLGALLGPLFIFLKLLPFAWCQGLFWSWVHAMIKYAFYRVFAAALVFIWATAEMLFITNLFGGVYTLPALIAMVGAIIVFNVACLILCLRLPRLVADFTGGSATAGGGLVGPAAVAATRFF